MKIRYLIQYTLRQYTLPLIGCLLLIGCQPKPSQSYEIGQILLKDDFEQNLHWENYARDDIRIGITNGTYHIHTNSNNYVRGFHLGTGYDNLILDVQAAQLTPRIDNAYGVICRASFDSTNANGYYFLIGSDGSYSIRKGQHGTITPLIAWTKSDAIYKGAASNHIRIICMDDYLALYVNGRFVADVYNREFTQGNIGFVAATKIGTITDVAFDNLTIYASLKR